MVGVKISTFVMLDKLQVQVGDTTMSICGKMFTFSILRFPVNILSYAKCLLAPTSH